MICLWKNSTSKTWCFKNNVSREATDFMILSSSLPPVGLLNNYLLCVVVLSMRKS